MNVEEKPQSSDETKADAAWAADADGGRGSVRGGSQPSPAVEPDLFPGGGRMAERVRAFDWSQTPLGPIDCWSSTLQTAVGIMLGAGSPMGIYWGPDFTFLYNDAGRVLIEEKHPDALGRSGSEVFSEVWETVEPMLADVMSGRGPIGGRDQNIQMEGDGPVGGTWFTYMFNPIPREDGSVAGVLATVTETTQRVRAEAALRNDRQLLQTIIDTIPVMLTIYDPHVQEVELNRHFERVTGWTPADTAETPVMELVYPDAEYRREIQGYMQSLKPGFKDIRMATKDGRIIETSWANVPIPDGRQVGIGIDISARKRAEDALRRYAQRLHLLHQIDEVIVSARSEAEVAQAVVQRIPRLLNCQRASIAYHDLDASELSLLAVNVEDETERGVGWREPLRPEWHPVLDRLARGQGYVVEDLQALSPSSPLMTRLQAEGIRAQVYEPILIDGELIGTLNLGLSEPGPLSEEKMEVVRELAVQLAIGLEQARLHEEVQRYAGELEELVRQRTAALEASEARFRTIFEEAAIGIALIETDGRVITTNPSFQGMLGYRDEELIGKPVFDLLAEVSDREDYLPQDLLMGRARKHVLEQRYVRKDGTTGVANITLSLLHQAGGQRPLVLALVEDITERKRAQQALIQTERLAIMGRMASSLAHEINNPVQSVVGCLGLAMEVLEDGEDATQFMDVAMEELQRAARIVHRMRDLGHQGEGHVEPADVGNLIEKVIVLTQNRAQNNHVTIHWEGSDGLPRVPMVRDRIEQVFLNLVLNGIDAMPQGGDLYIRAARTERPPGVEIAFADSGVGVPRETLDHLFEAFHSTKQVGLGLGLYVSRNIVQEHDGWIEVESEAGQGATFTVWLPAG